MSKTRTQTKTQRRTSAKAQKTDKNQVPDKPKAKCRIRNRRAKTLNVKLPTSQKGHIHAVLDSTGLKVYGEGEWKVRQHGYSKRRTWRKLHLGVDEATGEIEAEVLTEAGTDDAEMADVLLKQMSADIEQLSADGAYDKEKVYKAAATQGVGKITIPPRRDAVLWEENGTEPYPRNANLRRIGEIGRKSGKMRVATIVVR